MVYRTVGVGGNYADWGAVWTFLVTVSPLSDNYEFRQISDIIINAYPPNTPIDFNSRYVKFYCSWDDSHQGDPTKGYVTEINGNINIEFWNQNFTNRFADHFIMDGLKINRTAGSGSNVYGGIWGNGAMTITLENLILSSWTTLGSAWGIRTAQHSNRFYFSNIKITNINRGMLLVGVSPSTEDHIMEDISINGCSYGIAFATDDSSWILRNVVGTNCPSGAYIIDAGTTVRNKTFYNCADDDATLVNPAYSSINCKTNIIPGDEFQSTDFNDRNWLRLVEGAASLDGGASPIKGKAPLGVDFNANVLFSGYAPNLGQGGAVSTLQNTDISGFERPGVDDYYSIGAHEQQYSNFPES